MNHDTENPFKICTRLLDSIIGWGGCVLLLISPVFSQTEVVRVAAPAIENFRIIHPHLCSGAQPREEADFAALKTFGVKTIVCVDGTQPQVQLAKKYGLRYVHIPLPYSGISLEASRMLTQVVKECDTPIFVHCHHGLHRGPAAAAVCGIVQGAFSNSTAIEFLKSVGTSPEYAGLYRDVSRFKLLSEDEAAQLKPVVLVEQAEVEQLSDVMLRIEKHFSIIGREAKRDHANFSLTAQQLLAMGEEFQEAARLQKQHPELKDKFLKVAELALSLQHQGEKMVPATVFKLLEQRCILCHAENRSE